MPMPDAPRKYLLITEAQLQAARRFWPQVSDKTWTLTLRPDDEPMVLNRAPHRGIGFVTVELPKPEQLKEGMYYRRDMDVLILVSGELVR
jgi:hypothetical protein